MADVPPTPTWFINIDNPQTRRAYQGDLTEFMAFTGVDRLEPFRIVTRAHLLAWRCGLKRRVLAGATIRRKLATTTALPVNPSCGFETGSAIPVQSTPDNGRTRLLATTCGTRHQALIVLENSS